MALLFGILCTLYGIVNCGNYTDMNVYEVDVTETTQVTPSYSYFQNNTEVAAQIRGIASLKCRTQKNSDQLVIWMKRGNEQLLTAGLQVYSSETRYSVSHLRTQKIWELRIRDVRMSDKGIYECQITTHPPVSLFFDLQVVEAKAVISGPREIHVNEGSLVTLQCQVEYATETPLYVFWFHNETMINFQSKRPVTVTQQMFSSKLIIQNVTLADAGAYICEPHLAVPDNVTLHVLAGETSAAMQRDKSNSEQGLIYAHTSNRATTQCSQPLSYIIYYSLLNIVFLCLFNEIIL